VGKDTSGCLGVQQKRHPTAKSDKNSNTGERHVTIDEPNEARKTLKERNRPLLCEYSHSDEWNVRDSVTPAP
jgi:hypothetical protein